MRTYEALFIVTPELDDDGIQTVAKQFDDLVTENEGTIVRSEIWGKRKLAYPVKKQTEGVYALLRFQGQPDFVKRLENTFKLNDSVIRYLVTHFDEHTLALEAEQERRKEEELKASTAARPRRDDDDDSGPARGGRGRFDDDDDDSRPARGGRGRPRDDD